MGKHMKREREREEEGESEAREGIQFKQISDVVRILALHVNLSKLCGGRGMSASVVE
jgi:hypothetical protein